MQSNGTGSCDIIIPVWNNLEITRDCVESIIKHTQYPFRLVIIDNASDPPTREFLEGLQNRDNRVVVIRNEINVGYVKAINQGMRFSRADYVCLMNNDTVVTEGWLSELVDILRVNTDVGFVNPSSNTFCQFPGRLDIDAYAETLRNFKGQFQELYTCRAFSVLMKREVMLKVGYLDDTFGVGYFDDTDYSKRIQAAGYKTVRAKASYVYHKESQSFSKLKDKDAIFAENEKKFISKWGEPLRIAYVIPSLGRNETGRVSSNLNQIARSGHQAWIFTTRKQKQKLELIDHESIRFFVYPGFLFVFTVFYKIWKRKKNKKISLILSNNGHTKDLYSHFSHLLNVEVFKDDMPEVVEKIQALSFSGKP